MPEKTYYLHCKTCREDKPSEEFYQSAEDGRFRLSAHCIACTRAARQARRLHNAKLKRDNKSMNARCLSEREQKEKQREQELLDKACAALRKNREDYFNTSPAQEQKQNL